MDRSELLLPLGWSQTAIVLAPPILLQLALHMHSNNAQSDYDAYGQEMIMKDILYIVINVSVHLTLS